MASVLLPFSGNSEVCMDVSDIRRLYAYTDWASDRIAGAIRGLSEEQFTRHLVSSFPSIRDTLAHIASAEWIWLKRWMGESPQEAPGWTNAPSLATLSDQMHRIAAERQEYLGTLANERIGSILHYRSIKGDPFAMPLEQTLIHCANHSTYHRGQLVMMLRQVGAGAPTTDYTIFIRETSPQQG
jgi:uncharacterized damage-inducible protein DinB